MNNVKICILFTLIYTTTHALSIQDQDFDGVPDVIDQCLNTPFLNQVDETGCTTKILKLPYETEINGLTVALNLGYSVNADLMGRASQGTSKIRMTYYHNTWSYTLISGYYTHKQNQGSTDTTIRVKKRIQFSSNINVNISASVKIPTYDFIGNKTDYTMATSVSYYPTSSLSLFTGIGHTFINDESIITPLQDTNYFYIGTGYFLTKNFYLNLSYNYSESKFTLNYAAHSLGTTAYYQINKKWFTTFSYSREFDEDLHNVFNFTIGYKVW